MKLKSNTSLAAFSLMVSSLAWAGGSPVSLDNVEEREWPIFGRIQEEGAFLSGSTSVTYNHYRVSDSKRAVARFLNTRFTGLKDPECVRNILTKPGHLARIAAGFYVDAVGIDLKYLGGAKTPSSVGITLEYRQNDGLTENSGTGVSSRFSLPDVNCAVR